MAAAATIITMNTSTMAATIQTPTRTDGAERAEAAAGRVEVVVVVGADGVDGNGGSLQKSVQFIAPIVTRTSNKLA